VGDDVNLRVFMLAVVGELRWRVCGSDLHMCLCSGNKSR